MTDFSSCYGSGNLESTHLLYDMEEIVFGFSATTDMGSCKANE